MFCRLALLPSLYNFFFFNLQTDESFLFVSQDPALMNQHTNVAFQTDEQHGYFTLDFREPGKHLHDGDKAMQTIIIQRFIACIFYLQLSMHQCIRCR